MHVSYKNQEKKIFPFEGFKSKSYGLNRLTQYFIIILLHFTAEVHSFCKKC